MLEKRLLIFMLLSMVYMLPSGLLRSACGDASGPVKEKYGCVVEQPCPVFSAPCGNGTACIPFRHIKEGFVFVSLEDPEPVDIGDSRWFCINKGEYVRASSIEPVEPSSFRGMPISENQFFPFAWVILDSYAAREPGIYFQPWGQPVSKYTPVRIMETRKTGLWYWYRISEDRWLEQRRLAVVRKQPRPEEVGPKEKWIDIDLYEQVLAAYQGDRMVFATLVSSGVRDFPTEEGLYRIWTKARTAKMSGGEVGSNYYLLEDVPYQMYYQGNFALHGAYWHDNFGIPCSHGCINLSVEDSRWLFNWTSPSPSRRNWARSSKDEPGTWINIHRIPW
ncbi:MAG TPA: murein L,D-transpeptidase [Thermodesulfobacteriaceae bacterium]|nr:murein L,D-transpeptidase [Thermodesulfobacteriaceae bacterium]